VVVDLSIRMSGSAIHGDRSRTRQQQQRRREWHHWSVRFVVAFICDGDDRRCVAVSSASEFDVNSALRPIQQQIALSDDDDDDGDDVEDVGGMGADVVDGGEPNRSGARIVDTRSTSFASLVLLFV
jgi:hypothetical protein